MQEKLRNSSSPTALYYNLFEEVTSNTDLIAKM